MTFWLISMMCIAGSGCSMPAPDANPTMGIYSNRKVCEAWAALAGDSKIKYFCYETHTAFFSPYFGFTSQIFSVPNPSGQRP